MSTTAAAVIGSVIGFQFSAIIVLAYSLSKFRERLARCETRIDYYLNGRVGKHETDHV